MVGLWLGVLLAQAPEALVLENDRLAVRVERHEGAFQEEMAVLTRGGRRVVLVSVGSRLAPTTAMVPVELRGDWRFTAARRLGQSLILTGTGVERVIRFSPDGEEVLVTTRVEGLATERSLITGYLFLPDGLRSAATEVYAPGPTTAEGLVPEEVIRAPVVWARRNELGAAMMLEISPHRPLPFALLQGSTPGTPLAILGAGMAKVVRGTGEGWVWSERPARLPEGSVEWRLRVLLTSEADQVSPATLASRRLWPAYRHVWNGLPQVAPFAGYVQLVLDDEASPRWSGERVGTPISADRQVRLGSSANLVFSAWGKRWWGQQLSQSEAVERADQMVRLVLQGFRDGLPPLAFDSETGQWTTRSQGFDTREAAWTGIWLYHYANATSDEDLRRGARQAAIRVARLLSARLSREGRMPAVWTGSPGDASDPTDSAPAVWLFRLVGMEQQALTGMNALLTEAVDRGRYGTRGGRDELHRLGWTLGALLADESVGHERAIQNVADRIALLQRVWEPADEPQPTLRGLIAPSAASGTAGLAEHAWVAPLLVEAGIRTDRRDLAERGAMMARSLLGFLPHPLARENGYPALLSGSAGKASSGFRMLGRGGFAPWSGFVEGEGAILAGLALLTERFGGAVRSRSGWVVGLDGCAVDESGELVDLLAANPVPYPQARRVRVVGPNGDDAQELELSPVKGVRSIYARMVREGVQLVAVPTVPASPGASGRFSTSGSAWVASWGARGFELVLPALRMVEDTVVFEGEVGRTRLASRPFAIHINPELEQPRWPDHGWTRSDGLRPSAFFSLEWWGTADRGVGLAERHLQGVVESPEFVVAQERLAFDLHGLPDPQCWVELVQADTGEVLGRFEPTRTEPQVIEVDATGFAHRRLRLRLVDRSRNGWVGVSRVRVAGLILVDD